MRKTGKQRIDDKLSRYRTTDDGQGDESDGNRNDNPEDTRGTAPRAGKTRAEIHERAFRAGSDAAIAFLGKVVCFGAPKEMGSRGVYHADREFVRGFVETLMPLLGDTVPLLRGEIGRVLRETVIDDLYTISRASYEHIRNSNPPPYRARW